jgi:phosphopantothenoylcysteine synthetase/decarboxylase
MMMYGYRNYSTGKMGFSLAKQQFKEVLSNTNIVPLSLTPRNVNRINANAEEMFKAVKDNLKDYL